MKKILSTTILSSVLLFTGCAPRMEMQTQSSTIDDLNELSSFNIGITKLDSVLERLGGTPNVFKKDDESTKYIWISRKMTVEDNTNPLAYVIPFGGLLGAKMESKNKQKMLVLVFDKSETLIKKDLITKDGYMDPDMAKFQQNYLKNGAVIVPPTSM